MTALRVAVCPTRVLLSDKTDVWSRRKAFRKRPAVWFAVGCRLCALRGVGRPASNRLAMHDNDASSASAPRPRGPRERLVCGLGQSLGGNATAFGYSVTITASFGATELGRGSPRFGDLIVFGLGAVVAFGGLEGVASRGFRSPLEKGSDEVILLGTALAFISIVLAIAAARGIAAVLNGAWAWFGSAFGASLVFALVESVEFMFAEWLQERRGEPIEPDQ
jgi:hypothetical protein